MFKLTNYVMKFAPIGVGAAMAHTIGTQGPVCSLVWEPHTELLPWTDNFQIVFVFDLSW